MDPRKPSLEMWLTATREPLGHLVSDKDCEWPVASSPVLMGLPSISKKQTNKQKAICWRRDGHQLGVSTALQRT